jgi:hypothetical protein
VVLVVEAAALVVAVDFLAAVLAEVGNDNYR